MPSSLVTLGASTKRFAQERRFSRGRSRSQVLCHSLVNSKKKIIDVTVPIQPEDDQVQGPGDFTRRLAI